MLHARARENKQSKRSSPTQWSGERGKELHPRLPAPSQHNSQWSYLHSAYGNQAILRMLDGSVSRIDGKLGGAEPVRVSGQVREGEGAEGGGPKPAVPPTNIVATPAGTTPPHPFTAFITMARVTDPDCSVPPGGFGAAKVGVYRVVDANGELVTSKITISERFTKLDGPDEIYKLLHPNTYEATKGAFDDCYSLQSPNELPDFKLKVEQNHLVGSEIISKNHITYSPFGITLCSFKRTANGWSDHCKRF